MLSYARSKVKGDCEAMKDKLRKWVCEWVMRLAIMVVIALVGCGGTHDSDRRINHSDPRVIGRGRTATGMSFVATVNQRRPNQAERLFDGELESHAGCPLSVFVKEDAHSWSVEECYSPSEISREASVECFDGLLVVHLVAPSATRRIRLDLSNGKSITSPVMMVPRILGERRALYYQALHGPAPIPISATELDARGVALSRIRAVRVKECSRGTEYSMLGRRVLVTTKAPGDATLSIISHTISILGKRHLGLQVAIAGPRPAATGEAVLRPAAPFAWGIGRVCRPVGYTFIYGLLSVPQAKIYVKVGTTLRSFRRVAIPAAIQRNSVLAYTIVHAIPSELIVRSHGKIVRRKDLRRILAGSACV